MKKSMKLKVCLASAIACSSLLLAGQSHAQLVTGVGYHELSDDDISLGVISGSVGYQFGDGSSGFSYTPEFRIGTGVQDDTITDVKVEVEAFYGFALRGEYVFDNGAYLFAAPSYSNLEVKFSAGGFSATEDEWEFGGGGGIGYQFTDYTSVELAYEKFDDLDVIGIAVRMKF
ncbi:MAG: hypothetical protein A3H44_01490 [Gammaproteobacteria bacterium RIFCSPLOWO2_02_FULL_57_10]|nr:MAG: hypothetical protein A3H44_01490 [Gammaproteobacteria bacterium RIFCSPLOWO2_02_FULL_57_10]